MRFLPRLALATTVALASAQAFAHQGGITGRSGNPATGGGTCAACHGGSHFSGSASLTSGSTSVEINSVTTYTWTLATNAPAHGFDLSATGGTLAVTTGAGATQIQKAGSELTHSAPRTTGQYTFKWTAPSTPGTRKFYACFNQVNNDGTDSGDGPPVCTSQDIVVSAPPTAPAAANDSYSTPVDTVRDVAAPGVLANDTDLNGDALTAALVTDVSHGTLSLAPDGSFSYTPASAFSGMDSFTYKANDGALDSAPATVQINVAANSAPVAVNDGFTGTQGMALNRSAPGVLANDTDGDGDALTAVPVAGPSNGTLMLNANGSFTYTPAGGFAGADTFTYQASDGKANSAPATVTITVSPSAPAAQGGGGGGGGAPGAPLLALLAAAAALRRLSRAA